MAMSQHGETMTKQQILTTLGAAFSVAILAQAILAQGIGSQVSPRSCESFCLSGLRCLARGPPLWCAISAGPLDLRLGFVTDFVEVVGLALHSPPRGHCLVLPRPVHGNFPPGPPCGALLAELSPLFLPGGGGFDVLGLWHGFVGICIGPVSNP